MTVKLNLIDATKRGRGKGLKKRKGKSESNSFWGKKNFCCVFVDGGQKHVTRGRIRGRAKKSKDNRANLRENWDWGELCKNQEGRSGGRKKKAGKGRAETIKNWSHWKSGRAGRDVNFKRTFCLLPEERRKRCVVRSSLSIGEKMLKSRGISGEKGVKNNPRGSENLLFRALQNHTGGKRGEVQGRIHQNITPGENGKWPSTLKGHPEKDGAAHKTKSGTVRGGERLRGGRWGVEGERAGSWAYLEYGEKGD